jgi:hypothetical protein
VPACLSCNGKKSDTDVFEWYRRQRFYDPRRAMAIRAWIDGDLKLAMRLLQWANPSDTAKPAPTTVKQRPTEPNSGSGWSLQPA